MGEWRALMAGRVQSLVKLLRSPQPLIVAFVLLVCAALCGVLGWKAWNERTSTLSQSEADTRNLAHSLAQHASRTIDAIDIVLAGLVERLEHDGFGDAQSERMSRLLAARAKALPQVRELVVLDKDGNWAFSSRPTLPAINNGDRDYFLFHQSHPEAGLRIGEPLQSRATGRWSILLTRRVNQPNGAFSGVAVAAIDLDYLKNLYENLDTGKSGGIGLIRDDGIILLHTLENASGNLSGRPLFQTHLQTSPTGFYRSQSSIDGLTKWVAYEHLPDFPVVVTVARAEAETLAPWRADVLGDFIVGGLLCAMTAIAGWLIAAQLRLRAKAEATVRESETRYRLLAENAGDVVMRLGLDGVRRYVSAAVERVLGWKPQELVGARPLDILKSDHRSELEDVISAMGRGQDSATLVTQTRRKDGDYVWIETTFRLIRDEASGTPSEIIATLRDISKRKAAEEELEAANEKLRALAATDALTSLANRRSFDNALDRECRRAERAGQPISVLLIDIDKFKAYNDTYGHQEGDICLRQVAQAILRAFRRPGDLAARYGGEEFAIILPETDELGAMYVAEQLRSTVHTLALEHQGSETGVVTISSGVACVNAGGGTGVDKATLLHEADRALYEAKRSGRNKVVCASESQGSLHRVA